MVSTLLFLFCVVRKEKKILPYNTDEIDMLLLQIENNLFFILNIYIEFIVHASLSMNRKEKQEENTNR